MATTASTKPTNKATVTNFYKVLTFAPPTDIQLTVEAARVDSGATTLGETLKAIYDSPSFSQGPARDVARLFFLTFDRAPDATLFALVMDALRAGMSFEEVCKVALTLPGLPLSNDGWPQSLDFMNAILLRLFGPNYNPDWATEFALGLDNGTYTRHQLLAVASHFDSVAVAPGSAIETSLLYLAGASREATSYEIAHASDTTPGRIIEALAAGGLSATGGYAALTRTGNELNLSSDLASDLVWDLSTMTFKLGGTTAFKMFFSEDEGLSGSVAAFSRALATGTTSLDASEAIGKGKVTFTGSNEAPNVFKAPAAGSTAKGGAEADTLIGGAGNDVFTATGGQDMMTGGLGDDTFILGASNVYQDRAKPAVTTITDFGSGKDVLDFSRLLNKSVDISALVAVMATRVPSAAGVTPVVLPIPATNGLVTLIENNGAWVEGAGADVVSRSATEADVAALFGTGKLFSAPTQVTKSVVITADTRNSADVWLILNNTGVTAITDGTSGPQEVIQIAHLEGSWNVTLVGTIPVLLS
ncbi:MAG: Peptidase serralysin terminal [Pseudomonadota bacterium]|jgi:hypothetical protein